jgi:hypothetical protein
MKKILFAFLFCFSFVCCEKDPLENKEWFKNLKKPCDKNTICKLRINKATYANNTVYFTSYAGALCDMYFTVSLLNGNGETVKTYTVPEEMDAFNNEVIFVKEIYRCDQ